MPKPLRGIAVAGICALALLVGCSSDAEPVDDSPAASETASQPEQTEPAPEETVLESPDPEPEEPTEAEEPEPTAEEREPEEDPEPAQGAWSYDEDADGVRSATITTAGASLTFTSDPVMGSFAYLRAEEFTDDYVNTVLCTSLQGCGDATFLLGGQSSEHKFSRPDAADGDVRISFRQPRDIWSLITSADGMLQVVLTEASTDAEVVFEFDITGADPDFY